MGRTTIKPSHEVQRKERPALNPEVRENQLISLAVDEAEYQLRNHTASSQVITHYLKMGSTREKLERDIKIEEKKLLVAKTEALQSQKQQEALYKDALDAFKLYGGHGDNNDY